MSKINLDFDFLDEKTRSKILKGSVIPRPIAWITSLNSDGSINLAPFSFFNVISPSLLVVSFQKNMNKEKDTFINLVREKEGVIHIVDESLMERMDKTSLPLEPNQSEFDLLDLNLNPSLKIKTPGIKQALIGLEVKLEKTIQLQDYENKHTDAHLMILRVVAARLDPSIYDKEKAYILADKLKPLARLGGSDYGGIKILDYKRKF